MNAYHHSSELRNFSSRFLRLVVVIVLCLTNIASCISGDDPSLTAISQALRDEDKDPAATAKVLKDNLAKAKDKNVIPLLLDYLEGLEHRETMHTSILGRIAYYLQGVSGIKSHISTSIGGTIYNDKEDWEKDVSQWRTWWNTNKDYIYWDEQAQALKVKRH